MTKTRFVIATAFIFVIGCVVAACDSADLARKTRLNKAGHITCYSGGVKIFEGSSAGQIEKFESGADGYYFVDAKSKRLMETNADCVVAY